MRTQSRRKSLEWNDEQLHESKNGALKSSLDVVDDGRKHGTSVHAITRSKQPNEYDDGLWHGCCRLNGSNGANGLDEYF